MPTGETIPIPVTTTRRRVMAEIGGRSGLSAEFGCERKPRNREGYWRRAPKRNGAARRAPSAVARGLRRRRALRSLLDVRPDVVDGLLDRRDLLGFLVRDLGLELFL